MTYLTSRAYYKAASFSSLGTFRRLTRLDMSDAGLREILVAAPASHPTESCSTKSTHRRIPPSKPSATSPPPRT
ncbi:hypothetical protein SAMN04489742_4897 [Arthrobacter crystallopoietes]|uniref:Uncharacterized protein n=1 Tax=Crystallibacter crystallopoietes TaxID=37928 RepID=A0A1H1I0Z8_9MICC|nr:hypothetical protein SAMN04489742_4897 [Arthrobacter crystallopoietes]